METTRIYLARHGEVVNHHEFRYNGHYDVDITDEGVVQMERLADFFQNEGHGERVAAVYSSDLTRARKGAEIIGVRLAIEPAFTADLREIHLGRWDGLTREEGATLYPDEAHITFQDLATTRIGGGGENFLDVRDRVVPAFDGIVERHRGSAVVIVAHGGVNRVILCHVMGLDYDNFFTMEQDYGCLNVVEVFPDDVMMVKMLNGGPNQSLKKTVVY